MREACLVSDWRRVNGPGNSGVPWGSPVNFLLFDLVERIESERLKPGGNIGEGG